jgi:hypothetical protein
MPFRNYPEESVEREFLMRGGRSYMRSQTDPETGNIVLRHELPQPDNRYKELRRTRRENADYETYNSEDARDGQRRRAKRRIDKREEKAAKFADKHYKKKRIRFNGYIVIMMCMLSCALIL